jgi:uncharacterized protein (DUF1330 family)
MAAYVIVDVDVSDPTAYEEYKRLAPESIASHGGKYLARGGKVEILEGEWNPKRLVILEFPTMERAKEWVTSEHYRHARQMRHKAAKSHMIVVEGV